MPRTRREFIAYAGAGAASLALWQHMPWALAGEAKGRDQNDVHRFAGTRHLPIGQVDGQASYLAFDLPQGCYLLPAQPRSKESATAGDMPLTWVGRLGNTAALGWHGCTLIVSVLPKECGTSSSAARKRVLGVFADLVGATALPNTPSESARDRVESLVIAGLPKEHRKRTVEHYLTVEKAGGAHYAWTVIPCDTSSVLLWIGQYDGLLCVRNILGGPKVIPQRKRPRNDDPLAFQVPTGDWILRGGMVPPKGFLADFAPDLPAAFRWTNPAGASWTLHIDPLEDVSSPTGFVDYHRKRLSASAKGCKVTEQSIKVGREKYPLLSWTTPAEKRVRRSALLGIQDWRARITWIVQDAPGESGKLSRWSRGVAKNVLKRFHYWYVETYESWRARQKR